MKRTTSFSFTKESTARNVKRKVARDLRVDLIGIAAAVRAARGKRKEA